MGEQRVDDHEKPRAAAGPICAAAGGVAALPAGERLALALDGLADGFVLYDEADRLVLCNARHREIHALSAPAIVPGATFEEILRYGLERGQYAGAAGREAAWLTSRLAAHRQDQSAIEEELAGGRWLRVVERKTPDGGRVGLSVDITERKRQEERLAAIIEGTDVGTWEWNVQTGETRFNERWAGIVGLTLEAISPTTIDTWQRFCHPEDLARSAACLARHFRGETPFYECEARMRHADGHWVWVLDRGRVTSWTAAGAPEWMYGTHLDISERKATELALQASHGRLDQLLETSPTMVYAADALTWQPTYVSGKCRELYGVEPETILRSPSWWLESLHPDDKARVLAGIDHWYAAGAPGTHRHSYRLRRADGGHVWIEDRLRVLRDAGGAMTEIVGSHADVTARRRLEEQLAREHAFLDRIMATSISAIVVFDRNGAVRFANDEAERVLGIRADASSGRAFDAAAWRITAVDGGPFPAEDLPVARVMATGRPVRDVRHAIGWPDGSRRILSINAAPLEAPGEVEEGVVCSVTDITDQVEAENGLRRTEAIHRALFELCPVGIALNDFATGRYLDANRALLDALGYTKDEFLALSYFAVTPEEYHPLETPQRRSLLEDGRYGPFEKEYIRKDGSRFPVLLNGILVHDLDGRPLIWSIIEDISERKAEAALMREAAQRDPLTGIGNRRLFRDRLAQALERARRGRAHGAVAVLDLDHFKPINDRLGHRAGDEILIEVAGRLVACTRKADTVARFGGDEFVVLLDAIAARQDVAAIALKMQQALSRPFMVNGKPVELGVSIGLALFPSDSDDLEELLHMADIAMYQAKHGGRRQSRLYEPGLAGEPAARRSARRLAATPDAPEPAPHPARHTPGPPCPET